MSAMGRKATIGNQQLSFCFLINNEENRIRLTTWKEKGQAPVKFPGTKAG
jgi:hypothetical protein